MVFEGSDIVLYWQAELAYYCFTDAGIRHEIREITDKGLYYLLHSRILSFILVYIDSLMCGTSGIRWISIKALLRFCCSVA